MKNGQWHGGKGPESRVTDWKGYYGKLGKIFGKKDAENEHKKRYLLLDDNRTPSECWLDITQSKENLTVKTGTFDKDWEVVKTYDAFVKSIIDKGVPDIVSFDNDLTFSDYSRYGDVLRGKCSYHYEKERDNGIAAFRFLVEFCERHETKFPKIYIHTANEYARKVMEEKLKELIE